MTGPLPRVLFPLLLLAGACQGVTSSPVDLESVDGGASDRAAALGSLAFDDEGAARTGLPSVTVVVLAVSQVGVQMLRVTSIFDARGSSLSFEVQRVSPPIGPGTYTCGPGVSMRLHTAIDGQPFTGPASDGRCTITITDLGLDPGDKVAGTFSAVLRSAGGATKILTDGAFAIPVPAPDGL